MKNKAKILQTGGQDKIDALKKALEKETKQVTSVHVCNIDPKDAPDYTDAYIDSAYIGDRPMTEEELDKLNEDRDFVYEATLNQLH